MENEYSDSSNLTSNTAPEDSLKVQSDYQEDYNQVENDTTNLEDGNFNYTDLLNSQNFSLHHSTSLNRELEGINALASRSTSTISYNNVASDELKLESYSDKPSERIFNYNNTSTPQNRLSDYSEANDSPSSRKLSLTDLSPDFNYCSTPVTKKSHSSQLEPSSNSSIRFNAASLISLPFGYNNNTFTKIRADEIVFPTFHKKKLRIGEFKNEKKSKKGGVGVYGYDQDMYESQYVSETPESNFKNQYIEVMSNDNEKKSVYNLMVHNDYSSNPYKRRYQSFINERRRLLSLNEGVGETVDHVSLPDRFPKRPRKSYARRPRPEPEEKEASSPEVEMADEFIQQKKIPQLPCYTLPSLSPEYFNHIAELDKSNNDLESKLLKEMLETVTDAITFRQNAYNSLYHREYSEGNKAFDLNEFTQDTISKLNTSLKKSLTNVTNDLIILNYVKGMMKSDYDTVNSEENYEPYIDDTYDFKKLKRLFKHDLYSLSQTYFNPDYEDDEQPVNEKSVLVTSPSLTFYNGLKCVKGQCSTSNYLFRNEVVTECDSSTGCYLWKDDGSQKQGVNSLVGKTGPWTYDSKFAYDVMQQNKKKQLRSTLEFINDVCKVAIAEVRIPKPEWSEFTEYNCINGYCCSKCCTCRKATDHSKLYSTNFTHTPLDDRNLNFSIDTKIATVDLLKSVLGSCSCYCKCSSDGSHVMDRVINEYSQPLDHFNESISWYEVDTSGLTVDSATKRIVNEQIVQERFILRVKLDSLPLNLKLRFPFACKLDVHLDEDDANSKEDLETPRCSKEDVSKSTFFNKTSFSSDSNMDIDSGSNLEESHKSVEFDNSQYCSNLVKDFKFINDFTFWDALDILKSEQEELHRNLKKNERLNNPTVCFDPLEIDTSSTKTEKLVLTTDSFASDSKHDSYVEIALYLPYVPSTILPWEFELVDNSDLLAIENESQVQEGEGHKVDLLREYNVVTTSFKRVLRFMKMWVNKRNKHFLNERRLYEDYKRLWHMNIRYLGPTGDDIFSWGVLPVRALDLPDKFIPLPAGYKHNDISYPYINQGTTSPYQVHGYGIGDIYFRKTKFSQIQQQARIDSEMNALGTSRQRDSQTSRRKNVDDTASKGLDGEQPTRSNAYLVPFFSNLTGPSVRWTYNLIDSLKEPMERITDFKSMPIYKSIKCPEMNFYSLDSLVVYDRRNVVSDEELLQDELNYRVGQVWSKSEVRTFVEKYLMYPKNFTKIAQFLENKKCGDCVEFYYRFKYRLRLKQGLNELRARSKAKFDMTRHLKREGCIMNSLDNIFEDCKSEILNSFNDRNCMGVTSVSDYMLRCGSLDSGQKYEVQYTQHYEGPVSSDDEQQHTLDNIAEGYFLPRKYLSMTTRKGVKFPLGEYNDDTDAVIKKGCFLFDYSTNEEEQDSLDCDSDLMKSLVVSINSESFFNNRQRGAKRITLSNVDKILNKIEPQDYFVNITVPQDEPHPEYQNQEEQLPEYGEIRQEMDYDSESPTNGLQPQYEGMVTRKKVLSHVRYGYESPRVVRHPMKAKSKKKASKWTIDEKIAYNETFRVYGKDWNRLYVAMAPYGKTMDQIKNYYHKNIMKMRNDLY